jgi:hypothetical protein
MALDQTAADKLNSQSKKVMLEIDGAFLMAEELKKKVDRFWLLPMLFALFFCAEPTLVPLIPGAGLKGHPWFFAIGFGIMLLQATAWCLIEMVYKVLRAVLGCIVHNSPILNENDRDFLMHHKLY